MFKSICPLGMPCPHLVCSGKYCYFYRLVAVSLLRATAFTIDYLKREMEKEKTAD